MHLETSWIMIGDFFQGAAAALVALDGDDLGGAFEQQRARQSAGSGADLDNGAALEGAAGARNFAGDVEIEKKVLSQRLLGPQLMRLDHFAQRRQAVGAGSGACGSVPSVRARLS